MSAGNSIDKNAFSYQIRYTSFLADKVKNREETAQFSNKYARLGFDIFNCIYYAKKKFPTYRAYENFVSEFYIQNLSYTGGD